MLRYLLVFLMLFVTDAKAQTGGPRSGSSSRSTPAAQAQVSNDPFAVLNKIVVDDLQAALADATAHKDDMAAACYTALIPVVQHQQAQAGAGNAPQGALFELFQRARDVKRAVNAGLPDNISTACAPLVLDAEQTLLRLGGLVGLKLALPLP